MADIGSAWSRQRDFLGPHPPASTANTDHIHRKFLDVPYASLSPAYLLGTGKDHPNDKWWFDLEYVDDQLKSRD